MELDEIRQMRKTRYLVGHASITRYRDHDRDVIIKRSLSPSSAVPSMAVLKRPLVSYNWSVAHARSMWSWAQPQCEWSSLCHSAALHCTRITLQTDTTGNLICMHSQQIVQHWTDQFPFKMIAITVWRSHIIAASSWRSDRDQQLIEASPTLCVRQK